MFAELTMHEDSGPRLKGETSKTRNRNARTLTSYIPVVTALIGITIVIASVVFFFVESDIRRLMAVTVGLAILTVSVWFAANPFRRGTRRYKPYRREIEEFLQLAQLLNKQVVDEEGPEAVEGTKAKLHEAVDRMVAESHKTG